MWQAAPTEGLLKQKKNKDAGVNLILSLCEGWFKELCTLEAVSSVSECNFAKQHCKSSLSLDCTRNSCQQETEVPESMNCTINGPWLPGQKKKKKKKKRKVHRVKYHKEGNYFNYINEHILKKMGFGLAEVVWARSTLLVQRELRIQLCFGDAVPTQPIMQERTFKSLFQKNRSDWAQTLPCRNAA